MRREPVIANIDVSQIPGHVRVVYQRGSISDLLLMSHLLVAGFGGGGFPGERWADKEVIYVPDASVDQVQAVLASMLNAGRAEPSSRTFRWMELAAYLVPRWTRERVLTPSLHDLRADRAEALERFRGRWQRRWVHVALTLRAIACIVGTLRAASFAWFGGFLPQRVRRWWTS